METIQTPLTKRLGLTNPVFLAGMNVASGPELCAAVSNAGGLGCIGGFGYTPKFLQMQIDEIKENILPGKPFGIDLLLPKVGQGARKTNYDYTEGNLPQLIDIICKSGAKVFVSAVGVPPKWAVDKLHDAGILVMNMIGAPKHVDKALEVGVDIICAQGGEGGGHTGDIATSILIPAVVDKCKGRISKFTGEPIYVVAAGGIYDGRGLAMALALGASAVWVGTRFVCSKEAGAPRAHQEAIIKCDYQDTVRTTIYTGRPLRVVKSQYVLDWENNRKDELKQLLEKGIIPVKSDMKRVEQNPELADTYKDANPWLTGQVAGAIHEVLPAKDIIQQMVSQCVSILRNNSALITVQSRL